MVFLIERCGVDGFMLLIVLKIFLFDCYEILVVYDCVMEWVVKVVVNVVIIYYDNLFDVYNFVECNWIWMMLMEWIEGFDL